MSILNRANDGIHSVLIVLYKCLLVKGKTPKDNLLNLCAPLSLLSHYDEEKKSTGDKKDPQEKAKQTLNTWIKLGLFEEDAKGHISISSNYLVKKRDTDIEQNLKELPKIVRNIVLTEKNNKNLWASNKNMSADFTRALCWMLAQDIYTLPTESYDSIAEVEKKQIPDAVELRSFQNSTRWDGFRVWAGFLGFGWNSDSFKIDPTIAIKDNLHDIFGKNKELTQEQFFTRLSQILPVIDDGSYRIKVEQKLLKSQITKKAEGELSTSLSFALHRLDINGLIALETKSDAPAKTLIGRNNKEIGKVSHIITKLR